uniref:Uncharacterized protein n=1 Tax=Panagrolaimus davidi TaxID=227884 RepID=A0A914PC67_9BILA
MSMCMIAFAVGKANENKVSANMIAPFSWWCFIARCDHECQCGGYECAEGKKCIVASKSCGISMCCNPICVDN